MIPNSLPNRRLAEIALGNAPADIVIKDGVLLDVYTGRVMPKRSVAISEKWIAYVGPDASHTIGGRTNVIEANNRIISPGYMDTHTHLGCYWNISEFLEYAIPCGVTTLISEAESYACALGAEGFRAFLDQINDRPVKCYSLIPPMVTLSPATETLWLSRDETREFLKDDRVIGLGESYWQGTILTPDDRVLGLIHETLAAGKSVQGHAAGAADKKLAAYAAAGALSCHEAISTEDVLSRLELGYYVMIREGHIRHDLEVILPIKDEIDLRRIILVTDGTEPEVLIEQGYLVDVIQKAVNLGLSPVQAVQMVSLNPAEHFGLDHLTGGISPGRLADILLLPGPGRMRPDMVISNGRIVAENGKTKVPLPKVPYPKRLLNTVNINPILPSQLSMPAPATGPREYVRTTDIQPGGLVTREGSAKAITRKGEYSADPENDLLKIVFIERVSGRGEKFVGFVRGWGQKSGAVATTLCWDNSGVLAIGANDRDMAAAINRVIEMQGGTALSVEGNVLVDIPCNIAGYVSEMKIADMAQALNRFQKTINQLGSSLENAHLTLCTLTTAAIPFIRMTEKGYFRLRENDIVGL
jgi:adenine deaminase